ncbi:MAG: hypothetical protein AAB794_04035 [Patescibacteria group bacterium]
MAIRISKNRIALQGVRLDEAQGSSVASAGTTSDIWVVSGNTIHITGTTTMTGLPAAPQAGVWRRLMFDGAVLLTNGANFNVQGGANYTTSANDIVDVYADTTTKFYLYLRTKKGQIGFVFGDGTNVITTGEKKAVRVQAPRGGTITGWTVLSLDDTSGSISLDIWKDVYANYPPTVADTITAAAKPSITTAVGNTSTTLTGWTTAIAPGDVFTVNVDSVTSFKSIGLYLYVTWT